jgi:hypothetical protein
MKSAPSPLPSPPMGERGKDCHSAWFIPLSPTGGEGRGEGVFLYLIYPVSNWHSAGVLRIIVGISNAVPDRFFPL